MDKRRLRQYIRKIQLIKENINDIALWSADYTIKEILQDKKTRYAIYKAYQEVVEAFMDLIAMVVKDLGLLPEDDFTNIQKVIERRILTDDLGNILELSNNTRNWIIHRYNKLNDEQILRRIFNTLKRFPEIIMVIEEWIKLKF
ncbi:MAG: DUF86 domain-containing protein [Candidatus Njordarchaeia archaeon]